MTALVRLCLRYRLLVFMAAALIAVLGVRSALELPIDAVPDMTNVQVQVLTSAPAMGPLEVERSVTVPIERAMSGLPEMIEIRSISRAGLSAITLVFEEGSDLLLHRQLIQERLSAVIGELPHGLEGPELGPMSSGLGEIYQFEVRAERMCEGAPAPDCWTSMRLRTLLDWFISFQLRQVPGVVEVSSFGGDLETWEVQVDPEKLMAYGLSFATLYEAIAQNQGNVGGGYLVRSGERASIRGEGRIFEIDEIAEIPIAYTEDGRAIVVSDVAEVAIAPMLSHGAVTRDARGEIVSAIVMMLTDANGREVVGRIQEKIEEIQGSLPEGVTIDTFYDRSVLVKSTMETVAKNLTEGALFVIGILFFLLGTLRGGLIVALAIPFAMLVAFIGMRWAGISGNLMSLGAIDFGIVVDSTIIVVENAVVHLTAIIRRKGRPLSYREAAEVVLGSTVEVRRAATFGEMIIVMVYIPILTLAGVEGKIFVPMAATVLFALLGAFVASLTLIPVMVATFMRHGQQKGEPFLVRLLDRGYRPLLQWSMRRPFVVAGVAVILLLGAVWQGGRLGMDFIPRLDEGDLAVQLMRLPSVTLEESVAGSTRFEAMMLEFDEVSSVICKTGRPEIATDPMGVDLSDCILNLTPRTTWAEGMTQEKLVERMEEALQDELPDLGYAFSQPIELRMDELISGTNADLAVTVHGEDLTTLARISSEVQQALRGVPGAVDIRGEHLAGAPSVDIRLDRMQANRRGIGTQELMDVVEAAGGRQVGTVWPQDDLVERQVPLVVRLPKAWRDEPMKLALVPLRGAGPAVPLQEVAEIEISDQPASISRVAIGRKTAVEANVRGRDLASFVQNARQVVDAQVSLPTGYTLSWGGQYEHLAHAIERLALVVPVALVVIFVLLYLAFGAPGPAAMIFLNVPLAAVGGVFALSLRGLPLSISAVIGFIALFGVAVLNGIVLLTTIKQLREGGMGSREAAEKGALRRLHAVMMTSLVASLGFLPMAMSTSAGAEVQRPLATVVIGGLVTATFLTLLVLPSLYPLLFRDEVEG